MAFCCFDLYLKNEMSYEFDFCSLWPKEEFDMRYN